MDTKTIATKLAEYHGTRDPVRISRECGYIIIDTPLNDMRGYYQYIKRCHIIYLDDKLSCHDRNLVCAHELGHSILHKGFNRIFMDQKTYMVASRYELEADRFAVDLIYADDELREYMDCSFDAVAQCLGISCELAEYRMSSIA